MWLTSKLRSEEHIFEWPHGSPSGCRRILFRNGLACRRLRSSRVRSVYTLYWGRTASSSLVYLQVMVESIRIFQVTFFRYKNSNSWREQFGDRVLDVLLCGTCSLPVWGKWFKNNSSLVSYNFHYYHTAQLVDDLPSIENIYSFRRLQWMWSHK